MFFTTVVVFCIKRYFWEHTYTVHAQKPVIPAQNSSFLHKQRYFYRNGNMLIHKTLYCSVKSSMCMHKAATFLMKKNVFLIFMHNHATVL